MYYIEYTKLSEKMSVKTVTGTGRFGAYAILKSLTVTPRYRLNRASVARPFLHQATELGAPCVVLDALRTCLALRIYAACRDVFATVYLHSVRNPKGGLR